MELKKAVRTAQTYAAPLLELKTWSQRTYRELVRIPSDPSYQSFNSFPLAADRQFLDIGANRGQTIASFRLYQATYPVLAFEPNPLLAERLRQQFAHSDLTTIHPFGLGFEDGVFDLYVPYYRGFMFDGLASFDWRSAHDWLSADTIYGFRERHLHIEKVQCQVRAWDAVETEPGLVKIDVQGYESNVLQGGLETIRRCRPIFLIENDAKRAHEPILFAEGYRRAAYRRGTVTLDRFGLVNTYYIPEEKAVDIEAAHTA